MKSSIMVDGGQSRTKQAGDGRLRHKWGRDLGRFRGHRGHWLMPQRLVRLFMVWIFQGNYIVFHGIRSNRGITCNRTWALGEGADGIECAWVRCTSGRGVGSEVSRQGPRRRCYYCCRCRRGCRRRCRCRCCHGWRRVYCRGCGGCGHVYGTVAASTQLTQGGLPVGDCFRGLGHARQRIVTETVSLRSDHNTGLLCSSRVRQEDRRYNNDGKQPESRDRKEDNRVRDEFHRATKWRKPP